PASAGRDALGALGGQLDRQLPAHPGGAAEVADLEQGVGTGRQRLTTQPSQAGRSVEQFDADVGVVAGGGGTHDGAPALGGAPAAADHATEVAGTDAHVEADLAPIGRGVDLHGVGIVDDRTDD